MTELEMLRKYVQEAHHPVVAHLNVSSEGTILVSTGDCVVELFERVADGKNPIGEWGFLEEPQN